MAIDNDKMFDLLEKIYVEVQDTKIEVKKHTERLDGIDGRLDKLESGQTRLEHALEDTRKTLFDGYGQNSEGIKRLETKINDLSDKVDKHDIKIEVIEGGKKRKVK